MIVRFLIVLFSVLSVVRPCLGAQPSDADLARADSVAARYLNHPLSDLDLLSTRLTASLPTDAEKFRAIYKWVCGNIDYDRVIYLQNKTMREKLAGAELITWNLKLTAQMFRELAHNRKTICTGYAWLIKDLATRAGLICVIVDGYGRNSSVNVGGPGIPNHSWNAVRLDGRWYLCDPTWSAGFFNGSSEQFIHKFNPAYFLTDPSLFILNHYPLNQKWSLVEDAPSLQEFLNGPLIYGGALRYRVHPAKPDRYEIRMTRGDTMEIHFSMRDAKSGKIFLFSDNTRVSCVVSHSRSTDGSETFVLRRRLNGRGIHALDVMVNAEWVLSYKVRVE